MRRTLLLLAAAAGAAAAQPLPTTPRCAQALEALRADEARLPASSATASPALARHTALRRDAARACLGGGGSNVPPQHAREPLAVPPVGLPRPPAAPPVQPVRPPLPAPNAGAPLVITACDAAGCWTSDGNYLQRAGAGLFGPRGLCSVLGSTVTCP